MTFTELWDHEVRKLAEACVPERRVIEICAKGDDYTPTKDEKKYLEEMGDKYKDLLAMWYISDMIWRVEHALADNRLPIAKLAAMNIKTVLARPSYFQNVFKGDASSDEWKNLDALRQGLEKILVAPD